MTQLRYSTLNCNIWRNSWYTNLCVCCSMFQTMVATDSASDAESYSEIIATNRESKFSLFYLISFKNTLPVGPLAPEIRTRIPGKNSVSVGLRRLKVYRLHIHQQEADKSHCIARFLYDSILLHYFISRLVFAKFYPDTEFFPLTQWNMAFGTPVKCQILL